MNDEVLTKLYDKLGLQLGQAQDKLGYNKPNQTIPNHTKPYQTILNHTKPYNIKPNQTKPNTLQTPSRHPPDTLPTPSRHLPDTFRTPFWHLPDKGLQKHWRKKKGYGQTNERTNERTNGRFSKKPYSKTKKGKNNVEPLDPREVLIIVFSRNYIY